VSRPARPPAQQHAVEGSQVLDDSAFSDEFCRFLQGSVPSVDAAELLLALAGAPQRSWQAKELAASETEAERCLEQLEAGGLAARGSDERWQYRPANPALGGHVEMLALAYKERPVTLFRVIYALRDVKIRSFADAFKLKRR
jgi:hypothetical protein